MKIKKYKYYKNRKGQKILITKDDQSHPIAPFLGYNYDEDCDMRFNDQGFHDGVGGLTGTNPYDLVSEWGN